MLSPLEQAVDEALTKTISRLVDLGADTARASYDSLQSRYDFLDTVRVTKQKDRRTGRITMSSRDILFQEFGAGIGAIHPRGHEFGYIEDSWSVNHAQMFHNYGYWYYGKQKIDRIPAACHGQLLRTSRPGNSGKRDSRHYAGQPPSPPFPFPGNK